MKAYDLTKSFRWFRGILERYAKHYYKCWARARAFACIGMPIAMARSVYSGFHENEFG